MYHVRVRFEQRARRHVFHALSTRVARAPYRSGLLLSAALGTLVALVTLAGCARPTAVQRAMSLERKDKSQEAIALLREDLRDHPDHTDSRRLLIRILAFAGDVGAARAEADELARVTTDGEPIALIEIGHAYELTHHFDEALAAYDEAAARAPSSPLGPREGGMRAARWGEADVAVERLEEARRRGADDTEMLHALALAKMITGDVAGARATYEACAAKDDKDTTCLIGLATVALKKEDYAGALAAYNAVVLRAPEHTAARLGRAYCLILLGRKAEGMREIDRAAALGAPVANVTKLRDLAAR